MNAAETALENAEKAEAVTAAEALEDVLDAEIDTKEAENLAGGATTYAEYDSAKRAITYSDQAPYAADITNLACLLIGTRGRKSMSFVTSTAVLDGILSVAPHISVTEFVVKITLLPEKVFWLFIPSYFHASYRRKIKEYLRKTPPFLTESLVKRAAAIYTVNVFKAHLSYLT